MEDAGIEDSLTWQRLWNCTCSRPDEAHDGTAFRQLWWDPQRAAGWEERPLHVALQKHLDDSGRRHGPPANGQAPVTPTGSTSVHSVAVAHLSSITSEEATHTH